MSVAEIDPRGRRFGRKGGAGGDRFFAGLATGAGVLILATLVGVALFLMVKAWPALTASADELPGGAPYPAKVGNLARGNPDNNDSYYTFQAKFTWRLKSNKIQINY